MKKRYVLKKWVKVALSILLIMMILFMLNLIKKDQDKAIEKCVNGGTNIQVCKRGIYGY